MRKTLQAALLGAIFTLTGCVLAPQTIQLSETVGVQGRVSEARGAMVRVLDNREVDANRIGHRGGRSADKSPLLSDVPLAQALTQRLQNSLEQLGFGADEDNWQEPLKVQLDIQAFNYQCNENVIVNECTIEMRFLITVLDEQSRFSKPYGTREMRQLAASPVAEYNEKWVNEVLDKLWQYMFTDAELKQVLGIY